MNTHEIATKPKLLACPFCGSLTATSMGGEVNYKTEWHIECLGCDSSSGGHKTEIEAITAWNNRYLTEGKQDGK